MTLPKLRSLAACLMAASLFALQALPGAAHAGPLPPSESASPVVQPLCQPSINMQPLGGGYIGRVRQPVTIHWDWFCFPSAFQAFNINWGDANFDTYNCYFVCSSGGQDKQHTYGATVKCPGKVTAMGGSVVATFTVTVRP